MATLDYSSASSWAMLAQRPYPTNLPVWGWDGQAPLSTGNNNLAPYSQPTSSGYGVQAPMLLASRRQAAFQRANGALADGDLQYPMFVSGVSIDVALSGSTAQGRLTRDFYPRNFTLPSFTISGQSLDEDDYGLLCEFAHQAQRKTVNFGWQHLMQITIGAGGINGTQGGAYAVTINGQRNFNQTVKGSHQPIIAKGIVGSMPRQHTTGIPAPTWSFQFVVLGMIKGIYSEPLDVAVQQQTWFQLLQATSKLPNVISTDTIAGQPNTSLLNANKKILQSASKGQATIINSGGTQSTPATSNSTPAAPTATGRGKGKLGTPLGGLRP